LSARALSVTAIVADGLMRLSASARKAMLDSGQCPVSTDLARASAADLKFLQRLPRTRIGTSNRKRH
jgi:hypothetical protein